ncbi:hypothetical protein HPB50_029575 [Hyalomma asiaticum]|nr:hypothetical protein HPB50_029575 [Hyalomma asiaticum]
MQISGYSTSTHAFRGPAAVLWCGIDTLSVASWEHSCDLVTICSQYRTVLSKPARAATIIAACAALHNIVLAAREPALADDDDESEELPPSQQAADIDRPRSPMWAPAQQDVYLRGKLHRNRVVNFFRVQRPAHADHLRRVHRRLLRRRQCNAANIGTQWRYHRGNSRRAPIGPPVAAASKTPAPKPL